MNLDLPETTTPSFELVLDATYAVPMIEGIRISLRMLEIIANPQAKMGVMVGQNMQRFGPIDTSNVMIKNPLTLKNLGIGHNLNEQKAVIADFRKTFGGALRQCMANALEAVGCQTLYFVFYQQGAVVLLPSEEIPGSWRMGNIRMEGAKSLADERACVEVNEGSSEIYRDFWISLDELRHVARANEPQGTVDAIEEEAANREAGISSRKPAPWAPPTSPTTLNDADLMDEYEDCQFGGQPSGPPDSVGF